MWLFYGGLPWAWTLCEPISGYQTTQVSQKLWKAWVMAFVYMLLMGGCREMKPVSAAVQTALQILLLAMEFLCGVICERYDSPLHATYRHNCVYVGTLISWRNRLIIRVDSGAANHPWMKLTTTTDQSYDLMFHLAYILLALILVCTCPGTVILVLAFLLTHSLTLVVMCL